MPSLFSPHFYPQAPQELTGSYSYFIVVVVVVVVVIVVTLPQTFFSAKVSIPGNVELFFTPFPPPPFFPSFPFFSFFFSCVWHFLRYTNYRKFAKKKKRKGNSQTCKRVLLDAFQACSPFNCLYKYCQCLLCVLFCCRTQGIGAGGSFYIPNRNLFYNSGK